MWSTWDCKPILNQKEQTTHDIIWLDIFYSYLSTEDLNWFSCIKDLGLNKKWMNTVSYFLMLFSMLMQFSIEFKVRLEKQFYFERIYSKVLVKQGIWKRQKPPKVLVTKSLVNQLRSKYSRTILENVLKASFCLVIVFISGDVYCIGFWYPCSRKRWYFDEETIHVKSNWIWIISFPNVFLNWLACLHMTSHLRKLSHRDCFWHVRQKI